jgi:hypothetical protein
VDKNKKNNFKVRPFVSLVLLLSFGLMVFSGVALYLRPEGSVARWTSWEILGLDKKGWEGVHAIFVLTFVLVTVLHLVLNLKSLLRYLSPAMDKNRRIHRELIAAAALVTAFLAIAVLRLPPASMLMNLRSVIKDGSVVVRIQPPEPDFEKRSLKEISVHLGVSLDQITTFLEKAGVKIPGPDDSLETIARQNRTSPQNLYVLILSGLP